MVKDGVHAPAGGQMAAEIAAQPDVLTRQFREAQEAIREVAQRIRFSEPRFVVIAARGTSDHAALYAKYLVETRLGLPCGLASPSTLTGYGTQPEFTDVLWLGISQSGCSPDLVESTRAAAAAGALSVAVTNDRTSPLAAAADLHLDIAAGPELSVAATKTYTAQLQALWLLVAFWRGEDIGPASAVPEALTEVLADVTMTELATRYRNVQTLVTTGRGFSYPTAREAALKLMETCYLSAHAFSGADLLHGPFAMIDEDRPVVVVAPEGVGGELLRPVLARLRERGAETCVVGAEALGREYGARTVIALPPGLDEALSPIVQIAPLQRLALEMALSRGLDPDRPRGLRKVTGTR